MQGDQINGWVDRYSWCEGGGTGVRNFGLSFYPIYGEKAGISLFVRLFVNMACFCFAFGEQSPMQFGCGICRCQFKVERIVFLSHADYLLYKLVDAACDNKSNTHAYGFATCSSALRPRLSLAFRPVSSRKRGTYLVSSINEMQMQESIRLRLDRSYCGL